MQVHIAFHREVKPGRQGEMLEAMKKFGGAMQGKRGFRQCFALRDPESGAMVGLAIWDSAADLAAARPAMAEAIADVDFAALESSDPDVHMLEVLWGGGELLSTG